MGRGGLGGRGAEGGGGGGAGGQPPIRGGDLVVGGADVDAEDLVGVRRHLTRRRNPPGLNVSACFSMPVSTTNSPCSASARLAPSAGPGPNPGKTGWPFRIVSSITA